MDLKLTELIDNFFIWLLDGPEDDDFSSYNSVEEEIKPRRT